LGLVEQTEQQGVAASGIADIADIADGQRAGLGGVDGFRNARFFGERRGESPLRVVNSGLEDGGMPEGCEVGSESQGVTG
jgi:hypothetical protein